MRYLSPWPRVWTERRSVNGVRTATSTASKSLSVSEKASSWTCFMASKWLRFIFQLPAIRGLRLTGSRSFFFENRQAGQSLALEVLEAGAAAGGDVAESRLLEPEGTHRGARS